MFFLKNWEERGGGRVVNPAVYRTNILGIYSKNIALGIKQLASEQPSCVLQLQKEFVCVILEYERTHLEISAVLYSPAHLQLQIAH